MAKKPKYDEQIDCFCAFCELGTPVPGEGGEEHVVCPKKGVVRADYVCRRFRYDPLKRSPKEKPPLPDFHAVSLDD